MRASSFERTSWSLILRQTNAKAHDVALYLGRWSLRGTDPSGQAVLLSGESADVLRRQPDGRWLIATDNPWGAQLLSSP